MAALKVSGRCCALNGVVCSGCRGSNSTTSGTLPWGRDGGAARGLRPWRGFPAVVGLPSEGFARRIFDGASTPTVKAASAVRLLDSDGRVSMELSCAWSRPVTTVVFDGAQACAVAAGVTSVAKEASRPDFTGGAAAAAVAAVDSGVLLTLGRRCCFLTTAGSRSARRSARSRGPW